MRDIKDLCARRFTPAHAGNTLLNQLNQSWYRVHPRSRGEYCPGKPLYLQFIGSPPLTRGIQRAFQPCSCRHRFTPAHAGNTKLPIYNFQDNKVHPRSRGEYSTRRFNVFTRVGSPPLTRGIRWRRWRIPIPDGFTPAHAGNTWCSACWLQYRQVHPRSRGEYGIQSGTSKLTLGSPPLTRGILTEW